MLDQQWREKGFSVGVLVNGEQLFYQLFLKGLFGEDNVAGSRDANDMNSLAERVWNRRIAIRSYQEDDGETD